MDPDANLEEALKLSESLTEDFEAIPVKYLDDPKISDFLRDAAKLAELVASLNEWLADGGALPEDWER